MSAAQDDSSLVPDPTTDLHWSSFQGAIHDIFASNSKKHPGRLCVRETGSASSPARSFTYGQMNTAANILAHHLLRSGIERGEVVMIYAYRGVDLVLAIMGTLKAGATFSVIDPAYPPDRQIIYLDVAQPRALIVIEEASRLAGQLSDKVHSYIEEHLQLRTQVPGLRIQEDGSLRGGIIEGQDVLQSGETLSKDDPTVVIGPDSNPTLSFTSGSEGRPKGVLGRHFSLAYYFPWMAERFGLGPDDRFTMLSGIAHDPIQRDIFTPLFLGAQLLIPSQDDIQNEKLAEWMQRYGATVTHLTPAMGQILVGDASTEFPALHHAFFVGDVLIKRDCRSLQRLAPNVKIVNMYGSTETSRAVSYYEIRSRSQDASHLESLGDVIPAGKGMLDVQLLVVDRSDRSRICAPGEIGEIYVRAGGLAEGYLGLPDLTREKFVSNWFVDMERWRNADEAHANEPWRSFYMGPRDRLYKTGDLGRYSPEGDVECCGRADNQVKIRGFRIELGEIDTFLSRHPLVRENVTVVRKDKDEEAALVSYVVPEMSKWSQRSRNNDDGQHESEDMVSMLTRFRPLRDELREYLRGKLPSYSVPGVIIPLKKMPLNPNGKVDKPALPFPDPAQVAAAALKSTVAALPEHTETERALAEIWSKLLPQVDAHAIDRNESFFDLGGHSILAQQMISAIRRRWSGVDLSMGTVFSQPTLNSLATQIGRYQTGGVTGPEGGYPVGNEGQLDGFEEDYAADAQRLVDELPGSFKSFTGVDISDMSKPVTVFLTGASGFLGAYILRDLLSRAKPSINVIAHVRASDASTGRERIRQICQAYGFWSSDWPLRLSCVAGDLGKPYLGISTETFRELSERVDMVIHNGAWVHWVYPYNHLRATNVQGTVEALKLCSSGKAKRFVFISSTSVLDAPHYVQLSNEIVLKGGAGISEDDDLQGSSRGLSTGYGQSKWVAEYLVREAVRRDLTGTIIRPGYILGDSKTGGRILSLSLSLLSLLSSLRAFCVLSSPRISPAERTDDANKVTNTDDFLVRMLKACIQLSARPRIDNSINLVPVDHVARIVTASTLFPTADASVVVVVHVTGRPRPKFFQVLSTLERYGYQVPEVDYPSWRTLVEDFVAREQDPEGFALYVFGVFFFVWICHHPT